VSIVFVWTDKVSIVFVWANKVSSSDTYKDDEVPKEEKEEGHQIVQTKRRKKSK